MKIVSNNIHSYISNYSGQLNIEQEVTDGYIAIRNDNGSGSQTDYIVANGASGEVELYHYGTEKLSTKSTGIDVTGNITVSGTVDGRDVAADGALAASAVQPGDNVSGLVNDCWLPYQCLTVVTLPLWMVLTPVPSFVVMPMTTKLVEH